MALTPLTEPYFGFIVFSRSVLVPFTRGRVQGYFKLLFSITCHVSSSHCWPDSSDNELPYRSLSVQGLFLSLATQSLTTSSNYWYSVTINQHDFVTSFMSMEIQKMNRSNVLVTFMVHFLSAGMQSGTIVVQGMSVCTQENR